MNHALYNLLQGARVSVQAANPSQSRPLTAEERDELLAALRATDQLAERRNAERSQVKEETLGADDAG
jgi:hypothetical protein